MPQSQKQYTVLVVDDAKENLDLVSTLLKPKYRVKAAINAEKALKIVLSDDPPDLILLDIVMPEVTGYELCEKFKNHPGTSDIPVIFLTWMTDVQSEETGLKLGAVDYITKPISPPILFARVDTHLKIKAAKDFLVDKSKFLETEVNRRTEEIRAILDVTIHSLASLAETRDNETGNHILRTKYYVKALAEKLKHSSRFSDYLTDVRIETIYKCAPLHDIGKVGIPDRILLKPGKLTPEEFDIMKTHALVGSDAITHAEERLGIEVDFLKIAKEIAATHHEKWDGSGYPFGLKGDAIPLSGRLMAVADVYDALISARVYKPAMSHHQAIEMIVQGRGTHFDPDIVDALLQIADEFAAIAEKYKDN